MAIYDPWYALDLATRAELIMAEACIICGVSPNQMCVNNHDGKRARAFHQSRVSRASDKIRSNIDQRQS